MKIGFLTDKNGYRAPIHPESIEKYSLDVHLEKDIFDYLKYSESIQNNVKTISNFLEHLCVHDEYPKKIKGINNDRKWSATEALSSL